MRLSKLILFATGILAAQVPNPTQQRAPTRSVLLLECYSLRDAATWIHLDHAGLGMHGLQNA